MLFNKKLLAWVAVATISGAGTFGVADVLAESSNTGQQTLVQELAQKLGIDQSKVQSAFDQIHQDHKNQMQTDYQNRLDQLVKDGKITDAQKKLILDKFNELQSQKQSDMESLKNLTPDQRKTQMETRRKELDDWAKQNGIDPQYLFLHGFGKGMGHRGWMKKTVY